LTQENFALNLSAKSGNFGLANKSFYEINKEKQIKKYGKLLSKEASSAASTEDVEAGFLSTSLFGNKQSFSPTFKNINLMQKHISVKKAAERSFIHEERFNVFSPFDTFCSSATKHSKPCIFEI